MRRFFIIFTKKNILIFLAVIIVLVFAVLLFFGFVMAPSKIEGHSMENTIYDGDWLIINRMNIDTDMLKSGDVIIMQGEPKKYTLFKFLNNSKFAKRFIPSPIGEDWLKRVIAVGGDVVDIQNDSIYVNGVRLIEPYIKKRNSTFDRDVIVFPYTVPENQFFIMGDNRVASHDSRNVGAIDADEIVGTSNFRIFPFKRFGKFN